MIKALSSVTRDVEGEIVGESGKEDNEREDVETGELDIPHGTRVGLKVFQVTAGHAVTMEVWDISAKEWKLLMQLGQERKKEEIQRKITRTNSSLGSITTQGNDKSEATDSECSTESSLTPSSPYVLEAASRCDTVLLLFDGSDDTKQSFQEMIEIYESLSSIVSYSPSLPHAYSPNLIVVAAKCDAGNKSVNSLAKAEAWVRSLQRPPSYTEVSALEYLGIKALKRMIAKGKASLYRSTLTLNSTH